MLVRSGARPRVRRGVAVVALMILAGVGEGALIAEPGSSTPASHQESQHRHRHIRVPPSIKPVQRLTENSSRFNGGLGGWTSTDGSLSIASGPTHQGRGALRLTASHGPGEVTAWSPRATAHGSDRYVATAYVRAASAVRGVAAKLRFIGANGTVTDTELGQPKIDSRSAWTRLPIDVAISPIGTTAVQLGISVHDEKTGARQLIDDATIAQTPGGSTSVVGPLRVVGNQIIQGNGKPLIMRGMQRFGLEGATSNPLPTSAEVGQLKLWGANEVRISLGEQKWLKGNCHYQPSYRSVVDRMVKWVTSRGMVALLNLHFSSVGQCSQPGLTPMADSPGSIKFWRQVAARYRHDRLVAFDLFNEPYVSQRVWLNGGSFRFDGRVVQAAGMQQLYNTVRRTGAKNLVVVSGTDYASRAPTRALTGNNIAYGAHAYQCPNYPPPECTVPHPFNAANRLRHWVHFGRTHAVIVTEFGWPANNDGTFNANAINYAEAHGWGWSGFAWDGSTGGLFDLVDAEPASDGTTIEPNNTAMPIVAGYARNTLARSSH